MKEKRIACCYTRFSTDMQNQSSTIGQLRAIKKYCNENNIQIVETYIDEAQSGTNMNRVNFQRMIEDSYHSVWKYIVVYNMSRLSRSVKDILSIKDDLGERGIKILSVIERQDETPEGDFFNLITYGLNELFVKQFKRDSWRGLVVRANECKALGGRPPLGYKITKAGKYEIFPKEAEAVRLMFRMIIDGKSYRQIADYLNQEGYTNKGVPFTHRLTELLRNEKYTGVYIWNRSSVKDSDGKRNHHLSKPEDEIIRIDGGMPQIITKEEFDEVQKILDSRRQKKGKTIVNSKYLLAGLIKCGECGSAFCGEGNHCGQGKYKRLYYRCSGSKRNLVHCKCGDINAVYLHDYVQNVLLRMILKVENASIFQTFFNAQYGRKESTILDSIHKIEIDQEELKKTLNDNVNRMRFADEELYVEISKEIASLSSQRSENDVKLLKLRHELSYLQKVGKASIESSIRRFQKMAKAGSLSYKAMVHELIKQIIITRDEVRVEINFNKFLPDREDIDDLVVQFIEQRKDIAIRFNFINQDLTKKRLVTVIGSRNPVLQK